MQKNHLKPKADNHATPEVVKQTDFSSPLLCRKAAAKYLGIANQTLAQWATSGKVSLPFIKIGRKVMYNLTDLQTFIAANTHTKVTNSVQGKIHG